MGLSKVTVNVGSSGLGRRPINNDKISGILFYSATLPTGFSSTARVKKVFSLAEAEALGLAKTGTYDVHWYHVSEYFRIQPDGELWIGFFAVPGGTYDFSELATMAATASGEIRQLAIYANALTYASTQVTAIQTAIDALDASLKQIIVLYAADTSAVTAVTGWASITDLRTLTAKKVTVVIAESGSGQGAVLSAAKAYSITALGTALGAVSLAGVEQSIGNPANFNISDGIELETPALGNGDLISALSMSSLGSLKDKGYLIVRKYLPDLAGSYFERAPTAIAATNDYAWMETNRVVDKAIRLVRAALIPQLNQNIYVKSDGTLRDDSVGYFQDLAQTPLTQMEADGEISASTALVDPKQNVLSTSQLAVTIKIVPVGVAGEIIVNIGLTTSI
jgi:hypothetical protein